jgi:hypothetical protein
MFGVVVDVTKDDSYKISAKVVLQCDVGSSESLVYEEVSHIPNGAENF